MEFKESAGTSPCPAHAALLDSRACATGRFSDIPGGVASYTAIPQLGWFQLVFLFAVLDQQIFPQDPNKAPGDVAGDNWVRYADDETRTPGLSSPCGCSPYRGVFSREAQHTSWHADAFVTIQLRGAASKTFGRYRVE